MRQYVVFAIQPTSNWSHSTEKGKSIRMDQSKIWCIQQLPTIQRVPNSSATRTVSNKDPIGAKLIHMLAFLIIHKSFQDWWINKIDGNAGCPTMCIVTIKFHNYSLQWFWSFRGETADQTGRQTDACTRTYARHGVEVMPTANGNSKSV